MGDCLEDEGLGNWKVDPDGTQIIDWNPYVAEPASFATWLLCDLRQVTVLYSKRGIVMIDPTLKGYCPFK